MKNLVALFCVCALSSTLVKAQNFKNVVVDANAELRKVGSFTGIETSGAIDVYLSQGTEEAVAISAVNNDLRNYIKTEVKGNTLHIYLDGKSLNWRGWGNNQIKAYVTFKTVNKIEASGACNFTTTDPIYANDLKLDFSGASDFKGNITATNLTLLISGASNIKIAGASKNTTIDASGASNLKSYDLKTDFCNAEASGAASIRIWINKELKATASGASFIYYKGDGFARDIDVSAGASIKKKTDNN